MVWATDWPWTGKDGPVATFNTREAAIAYIENQLGTQVERHTITSACPDGGSVVVKQLRAVKRHDGLTRTAYEIVEWEVEG